MQLQLLEISNSFAELVATWSGKKLPAGFFDRVMFMAYHYGGSMLRGAGVTLAVALVGTLAGCVIGFICGVSTTIPVKPADPLPKRIVLKLIRAVIYVYVEVFRGTPMMVQAMVIYYGLMSAGLRMSMWVAAFVIVSINTGAYMAETVRGGFESIDPGQTEGAKAIGMNHFKTMLHVIIPQALRNILPQIGNNLIINIKDTSVLNVIGTVELYFTSKQAAGTYLTYFEVFTLTLLIYLVMTVTCSRLLRLLERKMDGADSYELASKDVLVPTSGMLSRKKKGGRLS